MLFAQVVLWLLMFCYPLSTYGYSPKDAVLAEDINCYGGGIKFDSELYPMEYSYKDYIENNPKCVPFNDIRYGQDLVERIEALDGLIERVKKSKKCPLLSQLLQNFKTLQTYMWDYVGDIADPRKKHIIEVINRIKSDVHLYQGMITRQTHLCGVSDTATKIWPFWDLIVKLKELEQAIPPSSKVTVIKENGQEASTCHNVLASGTGDLDNFKVKIPWNKTKELTLDFEAYSVKDRVIVSSNRGETFYDSGCTSGKHSLVLNRSDLRGMQSLSINIKAKCAGDFGTVWDVRVDCQTEPSPPEKKKVSACDLYLQELILLLDKILKLYEPIQNHYWNKVLCYHEYEQILKEHVSLQESQLQTFQDQHRCIDCRKNAKAYKEKPKETPKTETVIMQREDKTRNKFLNSALFMKLKKNDNIISEEEERLRRKKQKLRRFIANQQSNTDTYPLNKEQFQFIKKEYCESNPNRLQLFDRLSKRYCKTAYETLLPPR